MGKGIEHQSSTEMVNNLTLQREYILNGVFTKLGRAEQLRTRWKRIGFVKPIGWQRRLF